MPEKFCICAVKEIKNSMLTFDRFRAAAHAAGIHLICSLLVALVSAALVLGIWYPFPYRELSGGRELFLLIVSIDIVCGPLLTLVIFDRKKRIDELRRDLLLVAVVQLCALGYGLSTVWEARPLFLALDKDRFKVVMASDLDVAALNNLPPGLRPSLFSGPTVIGLREPKTIEERSKVMLAAIEGGRDYAERPEFYIPFDEAVALKSLTRAKPLAKFLQIRPDQQNLAKQIATQNGIDITQAQYLPVIGRQDWVAVLTTKGQIAGYLKGDGF